MKIGQSYEIEFQFSQDQVDQFARVTGDDNPIHLDPVYAAKTIFRKPIMHGFLSASIFSRIFGTLFPGEGTIYLSQQLNFLKPMYVDQLYKAVVRIAEIFPDKHQAKISTEVHGDNGKLTISGDALVLHWDKF
ncbi:MAG: MaoC family dehydratase [Saprospirales bacterium]|nr:MaoC family dehydratase [Saprospirales bacterium]